MSVINVTSTPNPVSFSPVKVQAPSAPSAPSAVDRVVAQQQLRADVKAQASEAEVSKQDVKEMVHQANSQLSQASRERVSFSYEERLNRLYVQVRDSITGEVVKEIPPRQVIEHMAAVSEAIGLILDKNV